MWKYVFYVKFGGQLSTLMQKYRNHFLSVSHFRGQLSTIMQNYWNYLLKYVEFGGQLSYLMWEHGNPLLKCSSIWHLVGPVIQSYVEMWNNLFKHVAFRGYSCSALRRNNGN